MSTISIRKTAHKDGTRAVYRGADLIATIHNHPKFKSEKKPDAWNVCRLSGRVDWFPSFSEARNDALKG